MALVILFLSSEAHLDVLADEMKCLLAGVPVLDCTTAGEINLPRRQSAYAVLRVYLESFPSACVAACARSSVRQGQFDPAQKH
jgi:hypothetical protein